MGPLGEPPRGAPGPGSPSLGGGPRHPDAPFARAWRALEVRVRLKGEAQVQRLGALGLFLFVAVPLPGTGAWSGAVLAVVLGVRRRYAFPALALGVVAAGLLVLLLTGGTVYGLNYLR